MAKDIYYPVRMVINIRLKEKGIKTFVRVKQEEITDYGMEIVDAEGKKVSLEADSIVLAAGSSPDKTLYQAH